MKIVELCETTAGSIAAVAAPVGGLIARQPRNSDGTAKNALDQDNNLMGGPKKKKKKTTEGFASDAQRKAAFANGYNPKKKKKSKKA